MNLVAILLRVIVSKKLLILLLRKVSESTDNEVDDHAVDIMEGLLTNKMALVETGVVGLVEEVVPEVVHAIKNK